MICTNQEIEVDQVQETAVGTGSPRWNGRLKETVEAMRKLAQPGKEVFVELAPNGLAIVKSGMKCSVNNGQRMILEGYESVDVLENGWIVACKHGCYTLHDSEGNMYKGLLFLKKSNAIKFAKTL